MPEGSAQKTSRMAAYFGFTLQPQPHEFADELVTLFAGDPPAPVRPDMLDEMPWSMGELQHAIHRLNGGRSAAWSSSC